MICEKLTCKALDVLVRVEQLVDKRELAEAQEALTNLLRENRNAHRSGNVAWWLAIVSDFQGNLEEAMKHIERALQADPLCVPYHRSFEVIINRIRQALAADDRKPDDPSTPRLYRLLLESASADTESHIAMARFHAHRGDSAAALHLLDAVTTLEPTNRAAWQMTLELARTTGDTARVEAAGRQIAGLGTGKPVLFSIPGKAEG